ncbi:hypothetical protein [Roseomonas fluvialis]|uniref:Uncharacterized protein n=1 Tax=Roseomonas fluvialis TaxID=1750527 RepID=A0ABM7Y7S3_9PROT|nr:hypothetical protein [Roseomonas fluvialis]BDG74101.1 hypothetical protein Rmf_40300 [Roseomonas fluvialis]
MDMANTINPGASPAADLSVGIDMSEDLKTAALAIERVLSAAHERGSVDAVIILSTVSGLLRDVARYRGKAKES